MMFIIHVPSILYELSGNSLKFNYKNMSHCIIARNRIISMLNNKGFTFDKKFRVLDKFFYILKRNKRIVYSVDISTKEISDICYTKVVYINKISTLITYYNSIG